MPISQIPAEVGGPSGLGVRRAHQVVDDGIFQHALHVIARLLIRDRLDPIDHVDRARARVAIRAQPLVHVAAARVIGRDGERIAAVIGEDALEIARSQHDRHIGVGGQRCLIVGKADLPRLLARGGWHQLH
jgi:hypothetical protein